MEWRAREAYGREAMFTCGCCCGEMRGPPAGVTRDQSCMSAQRRCAVKRDDAPRRSGAWIIYVCARACVWVGACSRAEMRSLLC